jgi:hypothetical protein
MPAAPPPGTIVPNAALNGTIQPASPVFDPYAPGNAVVPPAGVPTAPYAAPYAPAPYAASPYDAGAACPPGGILPGATRFLQEVYFSDTEISRSIGSNGFGINDVVSNATFAFPMPYGQSPLLITPGFNTHFLNGPDSQPGEVIDLPARVYDAYLGAAWRPQFSPRFGADLAVSAGAYSDFQVVNWDSVRVLGRALATFTLSPQWKFEAGVVYLDRLSVKLLPAGGVIWTPNPDVKFDIVFPYPKLAQRLTTIGNTDVWGYIAGEYGGGQWSIVHNNGVEDVVNYNDLRVMLGLEWFGMNRWRGNLEVGYVFDRHILYRSGPEYSPGSTMMFRGALAF